MRKRTYTIIAFLTICVIQFSFGQDQIIDNLNKMPNFLNPSFYGFKEATKIGVVNKFPGKTFDNKLEQRYLFGNTFFEYSNFSWRNFLMQKAMPRKAKGVMNRKSLKRIPKMLFFCVI